MGEIKQTNFRIDSDTADRFRTFCEEAGLNQAQGFDHIMSVLEMDKAKAAVPERMTEIEEFERHTKAMLSAYLGSLEIAKSTEERVLEQFRSKLESKDETIMDLQNRLKEQMDLVIEARKESMELAEEKMVTEEERKAAVERMRAAETSAADKEKISNMLQIKLAEAEEKLERYPEVKAEATKLAEDLAAANRKYQELEKDKKIELERTVAAEEKKADQRVADVQKAADQSMIEAERKFNQEKILLQSEVSALKAASGEKDRQIEKLENKMDALQAAIDALRSKAAALESQNEVLKDALHEKIEAMAAEAVSADNEN